MSIAAPLDTREELTQALVADIRTLVECESAVQRPCGGRPECRRGRSARTYALGDDPERIVIDGCTHLRWRLGSGPSSVVVLCHHDTVWPLGSLARTRSG